MKPQSILLTLMITAAALVVGCDRSPTETPAGAGEFSAWDPAIAERAALVDDLPAETIAYLRLPSIWGLAGAPKGSALGAGLDTAANREAIEALQARLPEVLAAELGPLAPVLTLLFETLRSPLEIALVGEGPQPLEADLVIEGRFDYESVAEMDAAMRELTDQSSLLQLLDPAEGDGPGQILATMFPIFYDFDPGTGRARFLTGMGASAERLEASYAWQAPAQRPLDEFEQRIDASGHGLFVWADMARLGPMMRQGLDAEQLAQFESLGVFATRQLALGYGSSGGKARLAVLAEGREGRVWDLSLPAAGAIGFRSAGTPDFAFGMTLPGDEWLRKASESLGSGNGDDLSKLDERLQAEIGMDLASVVDTFAGRMIFVDDANGTYLVHEGGSAERWSAFWDALAGRFDIERSSRRIDGTEIHHLVIPGIDIGDQMDDLRGDNPGLAFIMARSMQAGTHLFWMSEDGRVLVAAVPQVLMARLDHPGDTDLGGWLSESGVDTAKAGLFGALHIDDAPRRNYYAYIGTLLGLADMLDAEIDVTRFPTARELALPETGTVGFALDYAEGRLGLTMAFENHPGDLFYAGGMSVVAAMGVMAAIAVPAYQDYRVRAEMTAAYASTGDFRDLVGRHVAEHGELPPVRLAQEWAAAIPLAPGVIEAVWQSEPAGLRLVLAGDAGRGAGAKLVVAPRVEAGMLLGWSCSGSGIEEAHLPSTCR